MKRYATLAVSQIIWIIGSLLMASWNGSYVPPSVVVLTFGIGFVSTLIAWFGGQGTNYKNDAYNSLAIWDGIKTISRYGIIGLIWFSYLIGSFVTFADRGTPAIFLSAVMMIPLMVITMALSGVFSESSGGTIVRSIDTDVDNMEKRKRERIDDVIRDLSDHDLLRLRRRLESVDEEDLYQMVVGDDGELLFQER